MKYLLIAALLVVGCGANNSAGFDMGTVSIIDTGEVVTIQDNVFSNDTLPILTHANIIHDTIYVYDTIYRNKTTYINNVENVHIGPNK